MRLLDTRTGQFVDKDPLHTTYAILSHTWDSIEQTYQEVLEIQKSYKNTAPPLLSIAERKPASARSKLRPSIFPRFGWPLSKARDTTPPSLSSVPILNSIWDDPRLSPKVRDACELARKNGYRYLWVDSCCIDKTSSTELSEAINSMYKWYACADVCYAFLAGVPAGGGHQDLGSRFRQSRWFTRGWTLQELIAPFEVIFVSWDWEVIGSKRGLADLIEKITGISPEALLHETPLDHPSVAQRLSWASKRETTRVEDRAYSLLGIFNINMSTLYGEGDGAFRRLQEEIIRRIPDQTIFAWTDASFDIGNTVRFATAELERGSRGSGYRVLIPRHEISFLAVSPDRFKGSGGINAVTHDVFHRLQLPHLSFTEYASSPHGIRTQALVIPLSVYLQPLNAVNYHRGLPSDWYLAILGCQSANQREHILARVCFIPASESGVEFLYRGNLCSESPPRQHQLIALSPEAIERCRSQAVLKTVYLSHPDRTDWSLQSVLHRPHKMVTLVLSRRDRDALRSEGYTAELRGPNQDRPTTHRLTLSADDHAITVKYQHILRDGNDLTIVASVRMLSGLEPVPNSSWKMHWRDPSYSPSRLVSKGWKTALDEKRVTLIAPGAKTVTVALTLGFVLAGPSCYFLEVRVHVSDDSTSHVDSAPRGTGRCANRQVVEHTGWRRERRERPRPPTPPRTSAGRLGKAAQLPDCSPTSEGFVGPVDVKRPVSDVVDQSEELKGEQKNEAQGMNVELSGEVPMDGDGGVCVPPES